jgi:hypothetical protein
LSIFTERPQLAHEHHQVRPGVDVKKNFFFFVKSSLSTRSNKLERLSRGNSVIYFTALSVNPVALDYTQISANLGRVGL